MANRMTIERLFRDRQAKARKQRQAEQAAEHRATIERQERERMDRLNRIQAVPYGEIDSDDERKPDNVLRVPI